MRRREFITLLGGAAIWPLAARAQQSGRVRRVGVLMSTAEGDPQEASNIGAFTKALGDAGWVGGRNVEIQYRWAAGNLDRMQQYALELVGFAPDVILAKGASVPAARRATSTIPIVFVVTTDAVAQEYVGSFARPEGNVTGFASHELTLVGKR